jgi:N-acetylglucosamine-6-phosphate deacetylase
LNTFKARRYESGGWVLLSIDGTRLARVEPVDGPEEVGPDDDWVAPAFWDVQFNGRWGVSFSDPDVRPGDVAEIVRAQAFLGSARVCPTLITAPFGATRAGVVAIAAACEADPDVAERVVGIHLEGPYISGVDGYRGAHPLSAVRDPDWDEFQRLQEASGGRVVLTTLAPEREGAIDFIRRAVRSGVVVAIGHTSADGPTLQAAADAGASLSTHLGNGLASPLPRHPNPIWDQAANDALAASFIADGHHLGPSVLRVLVRAKTPERSILVSDASPLAGLPPGVYGAWAVHPDGKIVVAGTPYLAGSNQGLETGVNTVLSVCGLPLPEVIDMATRHPARLLRREAPELKAGARADLIRFRMRSGAFSVSETCVGGQWTPADASPAPREVRPLAPTMSV